MRVRTRYDLADETGETRREKYERIGVPVPVFEIPSEGMYLWNWFFQLNSAIHRIDFNGYYNLMPPSEIFSWMELTKNLITPNEYGILNAMDNVFCEMLNNDIKAKRDKEDEKRKQEADSMKAKARMRRR